MRKGIFQEQHTLHLLISLLVFYVILYSGIQCHASHGVSVCKQNFILLFILGKKTYETEGIF